MVGYIPKFIHKEYEDRTIPYTGLSMREIFRRFVLSDGTDLQGKIRSGMVIEDAENAPNSQDDMFDKVNTITASPLSLEDLPMDINEPAPAEPAPAEPAPVESKS